MPVRKMQVAPATKEKTDPKYLCLCKVLFPTVFLARLAGLCPVVSNHRAGRCEYRKSWWWTGYTAGLLCFYVHQLSMHFDYANLLSGKGFMQTLRDVVNLLYAYCNLFLVVLGLIHIPKFVAAMAKVSAVFRDGVFCQPARRAAVTGHYVLLAFAGAMLALQFGIYYWLSRHTDFETSAITYFSELEFSQNVTLVFYCIYVSMMSVVLGTLACFEKLLMASLQYVPVHPIRGMSDNDNSRPFFAMFRYKLCPGEHPCPSKYSRLSRAQLVEYLRIFHQDISLAIRSYNRCMDFSFLFHTVVELIVLIIDYYAVVVYFVYDFSDPKHRPYHFINCFSCLVHTNGLYFFLKNGQQMKNMIDALTNILLEYSTRVSDDDEHLQIRVFIEKLKQDCPLTACGVFNIDTSIAGSISANILTYVLVALQFEIPKNKEL